MALMVRAINIFLGVFFVNNSVVRWIELLTYKILGRKTEGVVIRTARFQGMGEDQIHGQGRIIYYSYDDTEGIKWTGRMNGVYLKESYKIGDTLEVLYKPHDPKDSIVPTRREYLDKELLFFVLLIITIFIVISI